MNRKWLAWLFTILILNNEFVIATYHWRVADDGRKIEAVVESPHHLKMPGSLTDFLRQIENMEALNKHVNEMVKTANKIAVHQKIDNPQFEEEFRKQEDACVLSRGIKLEPESFHTSFSAELCPEFHESYQQYTAFVKEYFGSPPDNDKRPPRCSYWFEAVKIKGANNADLGKISISEKQLDEDELYLKALDMYFPSFAKFSRGADGIKQYGNMLSSMLSHADERISKNVYLHMATAAYWRAQGRLLDAYTCYTTGAQFVDTDVFPQLSTYHPSNALNSLRMSISTLLNHAGYNIDAYNMLKELAANEPVSCFKAMVSGAAGDASVLNGPEDNATSEGKSRKIQLKLTAKERSGVFSQTFNKYVDAVYFFKEAKAEHKQETGGLFDQLFDLAESKAYVLSCHLRLYDALEQQKMNLDVLVTEKNNLQADNNVKLEITRKIVNLSASQQMRTYHRLFYDQIKYGPHPYRKCQKMQINRFPKRQNPINMGIMLACHLTVTEEKYEEAMVTIRKTTIKNRPALNDTAWKVASSFTKNRAYEKVLLDISRDSTADGYFRNIPPKYTNNKIDESRDRYWRRADWPNSVDCQAVVSSSNPFRLNAFPQVFISPENRGWVISELLTKHIGLSASDPLPLPWFEPRCDFVETNDLKLFTAFEAIERLLNPRFDRRHEKYAEKTLKTTLVRLADRVLEDHDIGARIHLLMKYNIGPKWVSLNLAGLYWRVQGNPYQATKCLLAAFLDKPEESFISIVQLTQVMLKVTRMVGDAHGFLLQQLNLMAYKEPMFHFVQGRLKLLLHDVDKAIQHLKDALDKDPDNDVIAEDLLKIACSGKSTKPAISSQYPTVCCSPIVQNAVCIRPRKDDAEQCYVVDASNPEKPQLIYHRCNGVYDGLSRKTTDFANIVSPFLLVFNTVTRPDDVTNWVDQADGIQTIDISELPLDYGGWDSFFVERPGEWYDTAKNEMQYTMPMKEEETSDDWEEDWEADLAILPPKPLSFLWIREKSLMMQYDAKLPKHLPMPSTHHIRRGVASFPPSRGATMSCNGVSKLDILFDNPPSTWVSLNAKGENIEKYVDLKGPVPSMASLQPICPTVDKYDNSPILGLEHLPAFALSDQFLFYKPEKGLTEALKSLGSDRDTVEHVAARLHAAMLLSNAKEGQVNWLLCVLSSLYWRVNGDAENAMNCLRCALHTSPTHTRDAALVALANVCHQAGLLNSALIVAGSALSASPKLVSIHFTLANIYASIGDYERALSFYYSTLSLQANWQPAKDRIRAIYCHAGQDFEF